jgi:WD40 repeat protein
MRCTLLTCVHNKGYVCVVSVAGDRAPLRFRHSREPDKPQVSRTHTLVVCFLTHVQGVRAVAWGDGNTIATCGDDGHARTWTLDARTAQPGVAYADDVGLRCVRRPLYIASHLCAHTVRRSH